MKEAGSQASQLHALQADASSLAGCDATVAAALSKFGGIDTVIANAGASPNRNLEATTEAEFDSTIALNVKGPYFLAQKAVPHMKPGGSIVLLSTSLCAASTAGGHYLLYVMTKGAIEQMVRVMAKDLGPKGIRVNAIGPGPTATELFFKGKTEQVVNTIKGFSPFNRLGTPDNIARSMVMIAGPDADWVSGQILYVNGAMA